jgi:perosamine synthetase
MKYPLIKPNIGKEELEAVKKVFESGYLTEGPVTHEFEKEFAKYIGTAHAIAFTSCTTGLETALRALGIKKGDEVIIPDFTYPATAQAVYLVGATPVIVDVNKETYCIDYNEIEKAITDKTKVIMPVSEFGNPLDYEKLNIIKEKYNLFIVEDAACSIGAMHDNNKVGSFADISCFSLHPRKVITTGEGGMNTTNNDELAKKMNSIKHFGMEMDTDRHEIVFNRKIATNYKLSNILGAIGKEQLKKIEKIVNTKLQLAKNYNKLLESTNLLTAPLVSKEARHTYQTYCTYLNKKGIRNKLIKELKQFGIETQIGTYALSLQPAFKDTKQIGNLKISHNLFNNTLALPMANDLTYEDQRFIVEKIIETINNIEV